MPAMLMEPTAGDTLDPQQLWDRLMVERGFLSSPGGPRDAYRQTPATLPDDMSGPGSPVGKGYETLAIIELLTKTGVRVGPLGLGFFETGGFDKHAEAEVLKLLKSHPEMRAGKMVVVVETPVCPSCASKLTSWAKQAGLAAVDTYVPERQSMTSEAMASPKTTARTATMAGRPTLHLRFQGLQIPA
jgi:hypothetical protein